MSGQADHNLSSRSDEALQINSDFLSSIAPVRKSARLSSALLNYSRPEGINLVPLGSSWGLDVFARLHNGTRRELIDLYNMIDSMQRRVQDLRTPDLKLFFSWWKLFSSFLQVSLQCHDELLMTWVTQKTSLPESLNGEYRQEVKHKVNNMLKSFSVIQDNLSRRPPDETMAKIIKGLVDMHPIVEYFERIENSLPEVVEEVYKPRDAKKIEKKLASYLHNTGHPDIRRMHLLLMARAMTDEVLSAWQKTISLLVRLSFKSSNRRFEATHMLPIQQLAVE